MDSELASLSIQQLAPMLQKREVSPVEVTAAVLDRAELLNPRLNAYIEIRRMQALEAAKKVEEEIAQGHYRGPLHGVPMALKDIFWVKGERVTMGSKIHSDFVAQEDATIVAHLKKAGVVLTGSLNMHEYAWGATTNNPHFGPCHNPWDVTRIPGGSSGGSGAAVAADMSIASIGTDTGGSIRIPSSLCGIVGLKPTYGRVSKYGCFPLAWSLDHVGPMTKTVTDAALLLEAIEGYDPKDPTSIATNGGSYATGLDESLKGITVGVEEDYFFHEIDEEVEAAVRRAIERFEKLGATVRPVQIPHLQHAILAELITISTEASTIHHKNLMERPEDFGEDVRILLMAGEIPSAVEYLQAQQLRQTIKVEFARALEDIDILVTPALPCLPPRIGEESVTINGHPASYLDQAVRMMAPGNLTGYPALCMPCGLSNSGIPIGMMLYSKVFDEKTMLHAGYAFEQTQPLGQAKPAC